MTHEEKVAVERLRMQRVADVALGCLLGMTFMLGMAAFAVWWVS